VTRNGFTVGIAAVAIVAAGGGYWFGSHGGQSATTQTATADAGKNAPESARKLLYYRNPMGLPDTSPVPKKDPMGMDYIAVYEGAEGDGTRCGRHDEISTEKVQKLGVAPKRRRCARWPTVRAVGRVEPDERRLYTIRAEIRGLRRAAARQCHRPGRSARASRCSRSTARNWSPRSANTLIAVQGVDSLKDAGGRRRPACSSLPNRACRRG
jgi:hypothetical protein